MGTDIHLYKEKLVDGTWVTADGPWVEAVGSEGVAEVSDERRYPGRNYPLFGFLARGVRGDFAFSFTARGLPSDVCSEVKAVADDWGADVHNHSHLYLSELAQGLQFLRQLEPRDESSLDYIRRGIDEIIASFGEGNLDGERHRIVFWFDN